MAGNGQTMRSGSAVPLGLTMLPASRR